jgi:hypothetical protein
VKNIKLVSAKSSRIVGGLRRKTMMLNRPIVNNIFNIVAEDGPNEGDWLRRVKIAVTISGVLWNMLQNLKSDEPRADWISRRIHHFFKVHQAI